MSRKQKQPQEQPRTKKKSQPVAVIVGTSILIIALIAVFVYQPPRTTVPTTTTPSQPNQPSAYEFTKQGEVRFMTAGQAFITAIDVELATDEAERQMGLMYRDKLAEHQGMLFVFDDETIRSFWMKNTVLALDMIFVNGKNEIVTIHKSTSPYSEASYSSTKPAKYVVEVNAGFTDKYKISVGDRIVWRAL
jgi:uncharacterized membrane protein (UPF0127 family)